MRKPDFKNMAENAVIIMLTVMMVRIPLMHFICLMKGRYYKYIAIAVYNIAVPCLFLFLACLWINRKNIRITSYEAIFGLLLLFRIISCLNAVNTQKSLYGESGRNEGLFMLLCYYLFFYTARIIVSEKKRRLLLGIFIVVMALHALYGLAQFFNIQVGIPIFDHYYYAVSGVAGNPNFMSSLMVMAAAAAAGLTVFSETIRSKAVSFVLLAIFTATLIFTKTMSGYVGFGAVVVALVVVFIRGIYKKKGGKATLVTMLVLSVAGLAVLFVVNRLTYGIIFAEIKGLYIQTVQEFDINTVASGRFLIWKNIFDMLPQYIFSGVGIDCLIDPYYRGYGLLFGSYVDKAHNELIQVLITMGLPAFLCYIGIYRMVIKDLAARIKSDINRPVNMALLLIFIGYISQAMFNISVIDVAPYFWMLMGLSAKPVIKANSDENSTARL